MPQNETIVGLDLGSTSIRVAVGQKVYSEESKLPKLHIVGVVEVPSEGINRGLITNIDDAVKSVSVALDRAERITGLPIESAWVSYNGSNLNAQVSKGTVAISKTDGEISDEDVQRAIDAARMVTTPANYEILHVVPRYFNVDNQSKIKDPIGMNGIRLEVEAYIIEGVSTQIKNLTKCIYQTGLDIENIVLAPLACGEAVVMSKQKELGVAVVNIGSAMTTLSVYEQGDLIHVATIPIGSEHITSDVAIGLRTSIEVAELIKINHGIAVSKDVDKKEELDLSTIEPTEDGLVSKKYIAEIIEARVEEIFEKVDHELKKIDRSGQLPGGVVLCGGGAKLNKIIDVAKSILRLPASLGYPTNVTSVIDKVNDLAMATAVGLVKWGDQSTSGHSHASRFKSVGQVTDTMRKWFKSLMP